MFQVRPGQRKFPLPCKRFSLMGVRLYEHKGVLYSLPELEELTRHGMNHLMIGPHIEEDVEPHQHPHVFRWIVDFLAQFTRPQIHLFHFFGGIATDNY